jgi:hypothetical protein
VAMAVVTRASQEGSGGAAVLFTTGAGNLVLDSVVNSFSFLFSCINNAGNSTLTWRKLHVSQCSCKPGSPEPVLKHQIPYSKHDQTGNY